ncbi:two-component system catabolic regulation response regulator CreB [Pseudoxanthomonas taiwanensis J19]|uniref:Two-component system catabolic regulation response regulator CreB n=2 Tax=Lysobacteraceae TaxID=32033 RepID=A0A562E497_9GAMM|nr:two-component system catabolic regulation response regulator CreB [Pseudoxanthomonas taiwanensis J19]
MGRDYAWPMPSAPLILIVDDEPAIADTLLYALRSEGLQAEHCLLGGQAVERVRAGGVDVLVLDVGLPDIGGFDVCRQVRAFSGVPVIFLTARGEEIDRVLGLELGGDDYVAKPFSPREMVARVRARLRRHPAAGADAAWLERGDFAVDRAGHRIHYRGRPLDLTRYEYALLEALLQRPGAILSRAQLMDRAWDSAAASGDRTVDTHVKTLRAKLRAAGVEPDPIRTHRGLGYAIEA